MFVFRSFIIEFNISISIKRKIVSEDSFKYCPCCGVSVPSFSLTVKNWKIKEINLYIF